MTPMKRLLVALPLVGALVAGVLHVESKASNGRVDALEDRQRQDEIARARLDERLSWLVSAVWATAQRVGAPVPPPP